MNLRILIFGIAILFILAQASAHAEEFDEAKRLVDSNVSCSTLTNEQLGMIGDYYMEQMHPGEAHNLMHEMHGGENSEAVKEMHIAMAKSIYCGEANFSMMGSGMMGMMGSGMMGSSGTQGMMGSGMMGSYGMMGYGTANYFGIPTYVWNGLYLLLIIGATILVFLLIARVSLDFVKGNRK